MLSLVMAKCCVLFEVGTEFLNKISFGFKGLREFPSSPFVVFARLTTLGCIEKCIFMKLRIKNFQ
jgi:hypothetical protein